MDPKPIVIAAEAPSERELIPVSYVSRLDFANVFGRKAPLEVDLGCGDGAFLASVAAINPEHNFLGVERLAGRVRSACHKARNLPNVRVLRIETAYAVRYLFPPESVSIFYFLFPDPWPKRRHHERRVFKADFLEDLTRALAPGGLLHVATDQSDYFEQMRELSRGCNDLEDLNTEIEKMPATTFEKRFRSLNRPIYRLELRKISPVT
jgi:tRNA (guanine-N7-)-methyltransferase